MSTRAGHSLRACSPSSSCPTATPSRCCGSSARSARTGQDAAVTVRHDQRRSTLDRRDVEAAGGLADHRRPRGRVGRSRLRAYDPRRRCGRRSGRRARTGWSPSRDRTTRCAPPAISGDTSLRANTRRFSWTPGRSTSSTRQGRRGTSSFAATATATSRWRAAQRSLIGRAAGRLAYQRSMPEGSPDLLGVLAPRHPFGKQLRCHVSSDWLMVDRSAIESMARFASRQPGRDAPLRAHGDTQRVVLRHRSRRGPGHLGRPRTAGRSGSSPALRTPTPTGCRTSRISWPRAPTSARKFVDPEAMDRLDEARRG